ncbi:hypothetical protein B0O80DRAFT_482500 [Mortierella sp. GBAus27b]|nr:hypothetical protein B0O80DRAFT_482500 [Mortierella sp. GBAus27b]
MTARPTRTSGIGNQMDIAGLYRELTRKGLNPKPVDVKGLAQTPDTTFEVDLFGSFYTTIYDLILAAELRHPTTPTFHPPAAAAASTSGPTTAATQTTQSSAARASYPLAGIIRNTFATVHDVNIHIDGVHYTEKLRAYTSRNSNLNALVTRVTALQAKMDASKGGSSTVTKGIWTTRP